jgi:FSR family fosmidomycin resistance protein-like MFS transporter
MPSQSETIDATSRPVTRAASKTFFLVLAAISFCHLLNDMVQSLIVAIYPNLQKSLHLDLAQFGLITLTYQITASLLQPVVGTFTDKHPQPYSLPVGMGFTLAGMIVLARAMSFEMLLIGGALVGVGSSIFHPESSRIARVASGGKHGMAQSLFQVGGNGGSSLGPLLAALVVTPYGQQSVAWFAPAAVLGILILAGVGAWYQTHLAGKDSSGKTPRRHESISRRTVWISMTVLVALMFSKFFYLASLSNYYTFYLIRKFGVPVATSQRYLFVFLLSAAVGTIAGGPIGDRFGRRLVIWFSILGVLPFTLLLPHLNLFWTGVVSVPIGLILASAFSAIVVYAQDLAPGRVGMVSGIFFGLAFGLGGIGAAALGWLADRTSVEYIYQLCAYLPIIGLLTAFLPDIKKLVSGEPTEPAPSTTTC